MKHTLLASLFSVFTFSLFVMCEKPYSGIEDTVVSSDAVNGNTIEISFNVSGFEQVSFDDGNSYAKSTSTSVTDVCTRIGFALFKDGSKSVSENQTSDDSDFGQLTVSLEADSTYTLVVIAHNGTGNATISSPEEIKFSNNKVTDTFYYCDEFVAGDATEYSLTLKRAVAMFRLSITDNVPEEVTTVQFYYTGGSSTFDAETGYGCVNSRQTENRTVSSEAYTSASQYDIYTFPHSDGRYLDITVTAYDASDNAVYVREFEDVPVVINQITQYTGEFFSDSPSTGRIISLTVDDEWTYDNYDF